MEIGFIDYSHEERNTILATLKMLGNHEALDELGIGVVRDAYADILFPGISTLQTRAKYFVLLPYIFQSAEELVQKGRLRTSKELRQWITEEEDRLAPVLMSNSAPEETGIIGSNAYRSKRTVKVKPSSIYWNGLRQFGILRDNRVSFSSACKVTFSAGSRKASAKIKRGEESFDDLTANHSGEVLFMPLSPDYNYETDASIVLTAKEAAYLRDRILHSPYTSSSLLAFFIKRRMISNDFLSVPEQHLPAELRRDYNLAKDFSQFIYGAHIRYNIIYSNYSDEAMDERFVSWRDAFLSSSFDLKPILARVSCNPELAVFCQRFLDAVRKNETAEMDNLIIRRERAVKTARAKLKRPEEYRYDPDHPIHLYQLDYRFNRATIIRNTISLVFLMV